VNTNTALFLFLSVTIGSVFSFVAMVVWSAQRRKEREAYYRSETIKKVAESGSSTAALEFLRESERILARRLRGGLRLAGLIVMSAGVGVMVFLLALNPSKPIFLAGFIPLCVGAALFAYAQFLAPRE
jgi:hypothetical protein